MSKRYKTYLLRLLITHNYYIHILIHCIYSFTLYLGSQNHDDSLIKA